MTFDYKMINLRATQHLLVLLAPIALVTHPTTGILYLPQKYWIVTFHQAARDSVNATDMQFMTYDGELEKLAERWISSCRYRSPRKMDKPFYRLGQNIGIKVAEPEEEESAVKDIVQSWFNETANYTYTGNECHGECKHYIQMMWANASQVGCAVKYCDGIVRNRRAFYLACQYDKKATRERTPYTLPEGRADA
ncbi:hypothetical protein SprV_0100462300 [Sparganum proliferum]